MLMFGRNQPNIVKQLSFNLKNLKKKNRNDHTKTEMPPMAFKISGGTKNRDTDNFINLNFKSSTKEIKKIKRK